jgi:uncharacterized membrane protein SirB2
MLQSLHAFTEWVSNTPVSLLIQNISWIIPATQSVHIISIAVVMGSVALIDLRLLGVTGRSQSISSMVNRLVPAVWVALLVLFCSGGILVIGEPVRSLENPAFHAKMLMLLCVAALTFFFQRMLRGDVAFWELSPARRSTAKMAAVVSLLLWVGIVFAGRWIAYMDTGYSG